MRKKLCYRKPAQVKEWIETGRSTYPVCPRCGIMLEREYVRFCDNCGQKLEWKVSAKMQK